MIITLKVVITLTRDFSDRAQGNNIDGVYARTQIIEDENLITPPPPIPITK